MRSAIMNIIQRKATARINEEVMIFKKEIRDQLAEQKASNFEEFGIVPNVADAGRPGTGYYDKAGKFVVYGPHHLGAG